MKVGVRLAAYGLGLVVAFAGAFGAAGAVVPDSVVERWTEGNEMNNHDAGQDPASAGADTSNGLALSSAGYLLSSVDAPAAAGAAGRLTFQVRDAAGAAVTEYVSSHEKDLHLVVVRSDGSQFRHVHPVLDEGTGTWSTPWEWAEAGSYRVYADFTAAGADAVPVTLTRTVEVAGAYAPVAAGPARVDEVDGFTVSVAGEMAAGSSSELTITVERDGKPVTVLEPYLGAFGHLVALREGDLAYLHVHAEGPEPQTGETAGPEVVFAATAPSVGRYLLFLDFQVDGVVHTAELVLDAVHSAGTTGTETGTEKAPDPDGH